MLAMSADEWLVLRDKPQKGTLVEVNFSRQVVRKTQICDDPNEALGFQSLIRHLRNYPDERLVPIHSFSLTEEGYSYEMDYLHKELSNAEKLLVELYGEREEGSLAIEDQIVLERLTNRLPALSKFLDDSLNFYFDCHGLNLRRSATEQYRWIDVEGLHWQYFSDGRVFLAGELICENYRL